METDKVHTVIDFYDRPRSGLADFGGAPHVYDSIFDEARDEYSDLYRLTPIDPKLAALMMENWEIWLRWEKAFRSGKTAHETHPVLPKDRQRHGEIARRVQTYPQPDPALAIVKAGLFIPSKTIWFRRSDGLGRFKVRWSDPD